MAQTPVNERKRGFCEICGKEYANFSQHLNTQKHKRKAENENTETIQEKENNEKINTSNSTGSNINDDESALNGNGIIYTEGGKPEIKSRNRDDREMPEMSDNEAMQENKTIAGIQIIDSNTGKKQPSGLDRLLDIAFSPEIAPITLSIMDGIAKRLSGSANNEVEEGNLVKTVSGALVKVPNKEF